MQMLSLFLKNRARIAFERLLKQLQDLTQAEAMAGRRENWPDHPFGVGQDGSIAGIVIHVAAWKMMTMPLFFKGGKSMLREELNLNQECDRNDWNSILSWLVRTGEEWQQNLEDQPEEVFSENRAWGDKTIPFSEFVIEIIEHDAQHASQIEYIKVCRSV